MDIEVGMYALVGDKYTCAIGQITKTYDREVEITYNGVPKRVVDTLKIRIKKTSFSREECEQYYKDFLK